MAKVEWDYVDDVIDNGVADSSLESLTLQVKELQRNPDGFAKEQWVSYCEAHGGGTKDPARHTEEFLQNFVDSMQTRTPWPSPPTGESLQYGCHEDVARISECIKVMQKKSLNFRLAWTQFCAEFGAGTCDPTKHDLGYLTKFFDFLSQQASTNALSPASGPMARAMRNSNIEPPSKRMRTEMERPSFEAATACYAGVPAQQGVLRRGSKEYCVAQVKNFQRLGEQQRDLWAAYADTYLGGLRDPNRHDYATLQEFCENHHVPPPPGVQQWQAPPPTKAGIFGADDFHDDLVRRIKAYQKTGAEQGEAWRRFAGTTFDPARHEAVRLREFVDLNNVP